MIGVVETMDEDYGGLRGATGSGRTGRPRGRRNSQRASRRRSSADPAAEPIWVGPSRGPGAVTPCGRAGFGRRFLLLHFGKTGIECPVCSQGEHLRPRDV